jgi:hypothetical protein
MKVHRDMPWKVERVEVDRGMLYCKGKEGLTLIETCSKRLKG